MSEEFPNMVPNPPTEEEEKRAKWQEIAGKVEQFRDANNMPIDGDIKETLIAFNINELTTSQSCEGHIERGLPYPWIEIESPNEPEEKFVDEQEVFERMAKENQVPLEQLKRGQPEELYNAVLIERSKADYTEEYKQWMEKQEALLEKAEALLAEFYNGREDVSWSVRLTNHFGRIRSNEPDELAYAEGELNGADKEKIKALFQERRQEMAAFTGFLKTKFFGTSK